MNRPRSFVSSIALILTLGVAITTASPAHADAPAAPPTPAAPAATSAPAARPTLETQLDGVIDQAIRDQRIVGTVVVVAHRGKVVYRKAHGFADREAKRPMQIDAVHRLSSLTKPLVATAVLHLVDDGLIKLDDPVTTWLPDFRPKLADGTSPRITIRQLLTHTAGLTYRFDEAPGGPYHKLGVSDGMDAAGITLDENLRRLASAPLLSAPGAAWHYSLALDVLGRVVEKVTKLSLEAAVHKLVTGPLGMADTSFVATHPERLTTPYADGKPQPVRMTKAFRGPFAPGGIDFAPARATDNHAYFSGGAGMVSTADDFLHFLETIRTGGAPVLAPSTAALAVRNQIGALQAGFGPGSGFGLIGAVLVDPKAANQPSHAGTVSWGGVYGHTWWIDPAAELSVVILTNTAVEGLMGKFPVDVKAVIYRTLE